MLTLSDILRRPMHNALHTPDIETFVHYSIYDVSLDHNNDKFQIIMDDMKEIN